MGSAVGYAVGYMLDVKDKAGHQLTKRSPIDCLLNSRGVANPIVRQISGVYSCASDAQKWEKRGASRVAA